MANVLAVRIMIIISMLIDPTKTSPLYYYLKFNNDSDHYRQVRHGTCGKSAFECYIRGLCIHFVIFGSASTWKADRIQFLTTLLKVLVNNTLPQQFAVTVAKTQ